MSFCTVCGRARSESARFCTGCGTEFPGAGVAAGATAPAQIAEPRSAGTGPGDPLESFRAASPAETVTGPPDEPPSYRDQLPPPPPPPVRPLQEPPAQRRRAIVIAAGALAVLLVGGGSYALTTTLTAHGGASAQRPGSGRTYPAAHPTIRPATSAQSAAQPPSPSPSSQPTPTAARSSSPGTTVRVTAAAARNPAAPAVVALLDRYFTAINSHSYTGYQSVLDQQMREGNTASSFASGYRTTTDSAESLTSLSGTSGGGLAAAVTFVSHQQPADSPSDSSCTDWAITLYLVPGGSSYLIGPPPPGYRASYQAC
jgi:hypothetical protein